MLFMSMSAISELNITASLSLFQNKEKCNKKCTKNIKITSKNEHTSNNKHVRSKNDSI
jgi:hypothetical protein